jgi:hypothetical protein
VRPAQQLHFLDAPAGLELHFDLDFRVAAAAAAPQEVEVHLPRVGGDEAEQRQAFDGGSRASEERRRGEVALPDHALLIQRQVAVRREVVQLDEAIAGLFQCRLRPHQGLVLHQQLLLIHGDLVQQ